MPPSPSFARPPVAEVALAVYFAPAIGLKTVDLGRLWERFRDRYPRVEDQLALPPVVPEAFDGPPIGISIQLMAGHLGTRVWFLTQDGDEIVQVQPDRLIHNWRRTSVTQPYPRYATLRPAFADDVGELLRFVADEGLEPARIAQAELTYVNPIPMAALGESRNPAKLFAPWSGQYSDDFLPPPEDIRIGLQFRITDSSSGEPVGRLHVEGTPVLHQAAAGAEPQEVYLLQLFARGRPLGEGIEGALAFLDLGHDWIVRGFASLTTETMHSAWGRQE